MIGKSFKVFYKKRRAQTKSNDANKEFVKKQLDLRLKVQPTFPYKFSIAKSSTENPRAEASQSRASKISVQG